jgi:hypothetical protein
MLSRKSAALSRLEENEEVLTVASKARVSELEDEVREADLCDRIHKSALNVTLMKHGECFLLCIQLPPKQLLQSNSHIVKSCHAFRGGVSKTIVATSHIVSTMGRVN